jgi:acetoin utilization deacetylase AcuC-like enzyme
MTLLYYDPRFAEHRTGNHPERPARVTETFSYLQQVGIVKKCVLPSWQAVSPERLHYVHHPSYVESVKSLCESGGGYLDADTVVCDRSYEVACIAAGAACDAVARVLRGEDTTAFCLSRPPGHHALADQAMGFCLFNHVAIAARVAMKEFAIRKVLIVDFDVHHGNGTQDIFWNDADVGYFSIHRSPFYPGTGAASEKGYGLGEGTTRNVPLARDASRQEVLAKFADEVNEFADEVKPELLLISAGFDAHKNDPIGSLGLETEDFAPITNVLCDISRRHTKRRIVSILEGGYDCPALGESVHIHLERLLQSSAADT